MDTSNNAVKRRPTVKDVALRAGVSHTTVSLALRGSPRVSMDRVRAIQKLAKDMDYQPRAAAQLLRGRRTGQIGLLFTGGVEAAEAGLTGPILGQFIKACESEDIRYHIDFLGTDDVDGRTPYQFTSGLADGSLVAGWVSPSVHAWLQHHPEYPWVSVDEPAEYAVTTAADDGIYQALQHLAALGHRRIAYCGGPDEYLTHRLGREGLRRAAADFGLTLCDVYTTPWPHVTRRQEIQLFLTWAKRTLSAVNRPSAAICHGIHSARVFIHAALEKGLHVPEDISVISYGTAVDAEKGYPCLSCIEPDFSTVVRQALDMLQKRLAGRKIEQRKLAIPPTLVLRDTVAAARMDKKQTGKQKGKNA